MAGTNLGTAYVTIMPSTKGIKNSISDALGGEATEAGTKSGNMFTTALKGVLAGVGVAAIGKFFKDVISEGGALEQSFGGLETLYGDAADGMKEMAFQASQAGISANEYAEQAVGFGATLKQVFGEDTASAAKVANMAIMDMADNSAKLGTDLGSIQNTYSGLARQNFSMLDNLKIGYQGTAAEMARLINDSGVMGESFIATAENVKDISFDKYIEAIHTVQEELGMAGVAAQEGATTYEGSLKAMKAATKNLFANWSLGEDVWPALADLRIAVSNFLFNNLIPMIGNILKGIPSLIGDGLIMLFQNLQGMVESAKAFINNLAEGIKNNSGEFVEALKTLWEFAVGAFRATDWKGLGSALVNLLWTGLQELAPVLWDGIKWVGQQAWTAITEVDWIGAGKLLLSLIWAGILKLSSLIWESLKAVGLLAWEKFKEIDWIQLGKDVIKAIWNGLGAIGHWIWEKLQLLGKAAIEKFKSIDWIQLGKDVIKAIWEGLSAIGHWIYEKLQALGEAAVNKVTSIDWVGLGETVINFIVDGLSAIGNLIWETLKGIGEDALEEFLSIDWEGLGKLVIEAIKSGLTFSGIDVIKALLGIGEESKSGFEGVGWSHAGFGASFDIGSGMYDGASHVSGAASYIASVAATAGDVDGYGIGANVVIGIANGMYAYIEYAQQMALAVASYVTAAFTGIAGFQINSPSRVMRDKVGKPIAEGIAVGITEGMGMIDDAVIGVKKLTLGDFGEDYTYNATAAEGYNASPITINVYPSAGMDERGLADKVQQQLALAQRQRLAAWGTA